MSKNEYRFSGSGGLRLMCVGGVMDVLTVSLDLGDLTTRSMMIGNPSRGLRLIMFIRSRRAPYCSIACGKGTVLRGSPLKVDAGVNSFAGTLGLSKRSMRIVSAICRRAHVGASRVRCHTGRLAYGLRGTRKRGVKVIFHMDGGSITFHCALPQRKKGNDIAIGRRRANFHFPQRAAAFLYPRDSTVVK